MWRRRRWWWWWASDIQRYHPRIYCSVKPGRQLGYKLVLCTARTATSRSYTMHPLCMYKGCTYACTLAGPPTGYTSLVCLCSWQLRSRTLPILVLNLMISQLSATFAAYSRQGELVSSQADTRRVEEYFPVIDSRIC